MPSILAAAEDADDDDDDDGKMLLPLLVFAMFQILLCQMLFIIGIFKMVQFFSKFPFLPFIFLFFEQCLAVLKSYYSYLCTQESLLEEFRGLCQEWNPVRLHASKCLTHCSPPISIIFNKYLPTVFLSLDPKKTLFIFHFHLI